MMQKHACNEWISGAIKNKSKVTTFTKDKQDLSRIRNARDVTDTKLARHRRRRKNVIIEAV